MAEDVRVESEREREKHYRISVRRLELQDEDKRQTTRRQGVKVETKYLMLVLTCFSRCCKTVGESQGQRLLVCQDSFLTVAGDDGAIPAAIIPFRFFSPSLHWSAQAVGVGSGRPPPFHVKPCTASHSHPHPNSR